MAWIGEREKKKKGGKGGGKMTGRKQRNIEDTIYSTASNRIV